MLTCYGHRVRLPQSDLAYLAFRLALRDTLSDIETHLDLEEEPDPAVGYLTEVPFLEQVPLQVQVDLLADAWARHRKPELHEASLLDAAVVFAACVTAGRVIDDMPDVAVAMLRDGPQQVSARIIHRGSYRLEEMFEVFWDDQDFLMINEWQDLPPDHAQYLKEMMRLPDEAIEPMYEALRRWRVSPELAANLEGLATEAEIRVAMPMLDAWMSRQPFAPRARYDEETILTGIEDCYHDLRVGPCDSEQVAAETDCSLVMKISIRGKNPFDCTYEEWVACLRDDVRQAAREGTPLAPPPDAMDEVADLPARLRKAKTTGLEDGTRIEARGDGWVVIDSFYSFLLDPEEAIWGADDDAEDLPPMIFPTAEAAYRAWQRSQVVEEARAKRREAALKRLGRRDP